MLMQRRRRRRPLQQKSLFRRSNWISFQAIHITDYAPLWRGIPKRDIAKAFPAQQYSGGGVQENPALGSTGFKEFNFNGYG
jgi:hypothetical protein